jgi:hypothetical protein
MIYIKDIIQTEENGFWKIIMNNGLEYAFNPSYYKDGLKLSDTWFSKKDCCAGDYNEKLIYDIEIYHNFENKAMINIKTVNGYEFRQEINPWNKRKL